MIETGKNEQNYNAAMEAKDQSLHKNSQYLYLPNAEMRRFVKALMNEGASFRPYRAQKITGIHRMKFYRALKDPRFNDWYKQQRLIYQAALGPIVDDALFKAAISGDVSAIRTFYELEGRLKSGNGKKNALSFPVVNLIVEDNACKKYPPV